MVEQLGKVSIIVPVYKTEKYVQDTAVSLINQTYEDVEIILVDDGSPDKSPEICDNLAMQYAHIRVVHKENGGLSSARNAGIEHVSPDSKYVFFLDSDDTILPHALEDMMTLAAKENASIVMSNTYLTVPEEDRSQEKTALLFPSSLAYTDPKEFVLRTVMGNCRGWRATGILYSTKIIKEMGCRFPLGRISEDVVFNLQFLANADKIAYYNQPAIKVLKRAGSITHTFQNGFEDTIYYIDGQAKAFLERVGLDGETDKKYLDAMLCRNLVVYLFSIMSSKNKMDKAAKKVYAKKIIADERNRGVFRKKQPLPWFESKKTRFGIRLMYTLLRWKMDKLAIWVLSLIA